MSKYRPRTEFSTMLLIKHAFLVRKGFRVIKDNYFMTIFHVLYSKGLIQRVGPAVETGYVVVVRDVNNIYMYERERTKYTRE